MPKVVVLFCRTYEIQFEFQRRLNVLWGATHLPRSFRLKGLLISINRPIHLKDCRSANVYCTDRSREPGRWNNNTVRIKFSQLYFTGPRNVWPAYKKPTRTEWLNYATGILWWNLSKQTNSQYTRLSLSRLSNPVLEGSVWVPPGMAEYQWTSNYLNKYTTYIKTLLLGELFQEKIKSKTING